MKGYNAVTRSVCFRPDQAAWLKNHKEINVSGVMQQFLDAFIAQQPDIKQIKPDLKQIKVKHRPAGKAK